MADISMEVALWWNLQKGHHVVRLVLESIWVEAPLPDLVAASIVALTATGLGIAKLVIGRTSVIVVEKEAT